MSAIARLSTLQRLKKGINILTMKETACRRMSALSEKSDHKSVETGNAKVTYWRNQGFSEESDQEDKHILNVTFFVTITVCLVGSTFIWSYKPRYNLQEWAQREAYLQLRYREENNLPPIDHNLIDPEKVILPLDEELQDDDIVI